MSDKAMMKDAIYACTYGLKYLVYTEKRFNSCKSRFMLEQRLVGSFSIVLSFSQQVYNHIRNMTLNTPKKTYTHSQINLSDLESYCFAVK